jgi:hypothetical protein
VKPSTMRREMRFFGTPTPSERQMKRTSAPQCHGEGEFHRRDGSGYARRACASLWRLLCDHEIAVMSAGGEGSCGTLHWRYCSWSLAHKAPEVRWEHKVHRDPKGQQGPAGPQGVKGDP